MEELIIEGTHFGELMAKIKVDEMLSSSQISERCGVIPNQQNWQNLKGREFPTARHIKGLRNFYDVTVTVTLLKKKDVS